MNIENLYRAKANCKLYLGDRVIIDKDDNCHLLDLNNMKNEKIYSVLDTGVSPGDMVNLSGRDTVFHVQGKIDGAGKDEWLCPDCGVKMKHEESAILTSFPAKIEVRCPECGLRKYEKV